MAAQTIVPVAIANIIVGKRSRALNPAKVDAIAESIKAIGLQTPITVYVDGEGTHLVAGEHRLEAAKKLGWHSMEAIKITAAKRELWEIDENLARAPLSAEEERDQLIRHKELWQKQRDGAAAENTGAPCATNRGLGRPRGYAAETAAVIGKSKSQINRKLAAANSTQAAGGKKPSKRRTAVEIRRDTFVERTMPSLLGVAHAIEKMQDVPMGRLTEDERIEAVKIMETVRAGLKVLIDRCRLASEEAAYSSPT